MVRLSLALTLLLFSAAADAFVPLPAPRSSSRKVPSLSRHTAIDTSASAAQRDDDGEPTSNAIGRRDILSTVVAWGLTGLPLSAVAAVAADVAPDGSGLGVEDYLRSGMVSMPMGVSGQAGKSKPSTGVLLRDGVEPNRDGRTGDVLAEIVLRNNGQSGQGELMSVLTTFSSPWPLGKAISRLILLKNDALQLNKLR